MKLKSKNSSVKVNTNPRLCIRPMATAREEERDGDPQMLNSTTSSAPLLKGNTVKQWQLLGFWF